jgi:hypothetical protein
MAGGERAVQRETVKTLYQSHWLVSTPRLSRLSRDNGCRKPKTSEQPTMTIERPMFPPRSASVDSFPLQPAIGQPESQTLASDSPSPFEGVDAALLRFVGCLARIGLSLDQAGSVVSAELERAEALASKRRPRRYWVSGPYLVSGPV